MKFGRKKQATEQAGSESIEEQKKRKIRETLERHQGEDANSQADALEHILLADPGPATTDWLWKVLIVGLVGVLVLALIGMIGLAIVGKNNEAPVTVFASVLSGLLGLFVRGPAEGTS